MAVRGTTDHLPTELKKLPPWAKHFKKPVVQVDPEAMATRLYRPAYATGLWRVNHDGFIPEGVTTLTFATTREPKTVTTRTGTIEYRQIPRGAFFGYTKKDGALVARPEKAILDFLWWQNIEWNREEFERWRFQDNWKRLNRPRLIEFAKKWGEPRLVRAAEALLHYLG